MLSAIELRIWHTSADQWRNRGATNGACSLDALILDAAPDGCFGAGRAIPSAKADLARSPGARPAGSAVPAAPIRHPSGRSRTLPRRADKSAGAPASTLSFAVTLNPATTVNHPSVPLATTLWVRLLADSVRIPSTE